MSATYINLWFVLGRMATNIHIEVPDEEQYDRLKEIKNKYGLTWRGMLIRAADELEDG